MVTIKKWLHKLENEIKNKKKPKQEKERNRKYAKQARDRNFRVWKF